MEEKKLRVYKKFFSKISEAQKILIISHRNPDWDTLGSSTWLKQIIDDIKSDKKVDIFCVDEVPEKLKFIPKTNIIKNNFQTNYDLIIFVDIASVSQTWLQNNFPTLFDKKTFNTISIDHHISNEFFAKQNIVLWDYPSTTSIIYEIAKSLALKISKNAATSLLTGLLTDTWNLTHSNTNIIAYKYAWELIELWWDKDYIISNFFRKQDFLTLKTWWEIFSNSFIENWVLTWYITKKQLENIWSDTEKISWAIDYLNTTENIKLSCLLYEKQNFIKGSLRTLNDNINVSKIAKKYWWWGHKKAAWFTINWKILVEKNIEFENK